MHPVMCVCVCVCVCCVVRGVLVGGCVCSKRFFVLSRMSEACLRAELYERGMRGCMCAGPCEEGTGGRQEYHRFHINHIY